MTEVAALEAYAGQLSEAAAKATAVAEIQHKVVHGDANTDVLTESGNVPSLAKQAVMSQNKVNAALEEVSAQMAGAMVKTSIAKGLEDTVDGGYFSVPSADSKEYLVLYLNSAGTAIPQKIYPSAEALTTINELISTTAVESQIATLTDEEGGVHLSLTSRRLQVEAFELESTDSTATFIGDEEGGTTFYTDENRTVVGLLEVERTDRAGVFITDEEGGILPYPGSENQAVAPVSPFADGLMFSPLIVTSALRDQRIYLQNLLPRRSGITDVLGSVASTTTAASEYGEVLTLNGQAYGPGAILNLRQKSDPSKRRFIPLTIKHVPAQTVPVSPKILIIGDSICNRQGGQLLKQYLQELGLAPQFIGTMRGSAKATDAGDQGGELGEAREGWETGDFTNSITDRALILAPGAEQHYREEMNKTEQRDHNPFARAATGSDPASIVRNGYVFDPAFYQARFGLDTPDIVLQGLGTNNVRDRTASAIYDNVLDDDRIIQSQIRAAWPSAKIIRFVPGTAVNAARNALWLSHYLPLIRAMQKNMANLADAKAYMVPLWALMNPESGYTYSSSGGAGEDGFYTTDWSDDIHPWQASRLALFQALAPYIAAAATNLI
ncbi:SGNH/GDSL hydrolase family protein [Pseudomonas putida]|uniref:SGNH/GDSL hydrolase family protein n=1 Tax=Pseudomonas putida TaxID=303 RepID=UPI002364A2B9|nr:SGNH/GDSL hydrolase family protein [Pseudomonas putida]MDD2005608.1 SGNH/GDSL hydrolase family protein [Pseudomonas putida]